MDKDKRLTIPIPKEFDLQHIFECGQCFRWNKVAPGPAEIIGGPAEAPDSPEAADNDPAGDFDSPALSYTGIAYGKRVTMTKRGSELEIYPCTREEFDNIWHDYLDLGRDYGKIKKTLTKDDPMMKKAADFGYGIRILKQDLWEMIISFIISQNSNIPRIKGCIERLCAVAAGKEPIAEPGAEPGVEQGATQLPFPGPEVLARLTEEDLKPVRLGYRQKYIMKVSREVLDRGMPETEEELLALTGVGPKVAACISLFGLGKTESFPIDTWVKQVMHHLYNFDLEDMAGMKKYAEEHFGQLGGFAQQYLFYYMRETQGRQ